MSINNGGPAFPVSMTLRDYFAAKAMQGILATHPPASELGTFVQYAYRIADAMLKAREAA